MSAHCTKNSAQLARTPPLCIAIPARRSDSYQHGRSFYTDKRQRPAETKCCRQMNTEVNEVQDSIRVTLVRLVLRE